MAFTGREKWRRTACVMIGSLKREQWKGTDVKKSQANWFWLYLGRVLRCFFLENDFDWQNAVSALLYSNDTNLKGGMCNVWVAIYSQVWWNRKWEIFIFDHSTFKSHKYSSEHTSRILYVGRYFLNMELWKSLKCFRLWTHWKKRICTLGQLCHGKAPL